MKIINLKSMQENKINSAIYFDKNNLINFKYFNFKIFKRRVPKNFLLIYVLVVILKKNIN